MNKIDYREKVTDLPKDSTKFIETKKEDKTCAIKRSISIVFRKLRQNDMINAAACELIRPMGSTIFRLKALLKAHKTGYLMRAVFDMSGPACHNIDSWLIGLLEPIRQNFTPHFQFFYEIRMANSRPQKWYPLMSSDCSSLFLCSKQQNLSATTCKHKDTL